MCNFNLSYYNLNIQRISGSRKKNCLIPQYSFVKFELLVNTFSIILKESSGVQNFKFISQMSEGWIPITFRYKNQKDFIFYLLLILIIPCLLWFDLPTTSVLKFWKNITTPSFWFQNQSIPVLFEYQYHFIAIERENRWKLMLQLYDVIILARYFNPWTEIYFIRIHEK